MQTQVLIIQDGKPKRTVLLDDDNWESIARVDYIELDASGLVVPEYAEDYGFKIAGNMQNIVDAAHQTEENTNAKV